MGGKANNLIKLREAGYTVPEFIVLEASDIETDLQQNVEILRNKFPAETLFAVRSSASVEDSLYQSFAGQFTSYLNVSFVNLEDKIRAVYASGQNENVKLYQQINNADQHIKMSVVVQKMIAATKAGVAFGVHPISKAKDEKVIAVTEGLGDVLVNGTVSGQQYLIKGNEITERGDLLNDKEILLIIRILDELQILFNEVPQDIEFAFENEKFFLLQSRPVTGLNTPKEEEIIWDNSNIVESYPDLTFPLTFSFIEKMYEAVYRQFSLVLGISKHTVEANSNTFKSMLGLLNGRVYYNLNSWFRSLALLPGYSLNADFMQKMMGVKEKIDVDFSGPKKKKAGEYLAVGKALLGLILNLKNARKGAKEFIAGFEKIYEKFDRKDFDNTPIREIIADYRNFETLMVEQWKAPLVNDLFAMIYFGTLQKMTVPIDGDLHNKLIAGAKDIITTEPMKLLPEIAKQISENQDLLHLFITEDKASIWTELNSGRFPTELKKIQQYIDRWGDRSLAELKLETITYRQEPASLIAILQNYIAQKIYTYAESAQTQIQRKEAECLAKDFYKNNWIKQRVFRHVLRNARYFVSNRENLRYYRTKAFGMVRRMMLAIGKQLYAAALIDDKRDIFYLKIEEIIGLSADVKSLDLKQLIASRKTQYPFFEQHPLPQRLKTNGKQSIILNVRQEETSAASIKTTGLKGTPCSPGIVAARVRLIKELREGRVLQQSILATYSTDPGWVVLFPSCTGILTERGSMLSHAAIVSREMGIPCIVGLEHLMTTLKDGDDIIMDGTTGTVNIISSER